MTAVSSRNLALPLEASHLDSFLQGLGMAAWNRSHPKQPVAPEPAAEGDSQQPLGRELSEANRFAYAALCGISLSQLFPEPEQR